MVASSVDEQSGSAGHDPYERLNYTAPATGEYHLSISHFAGAVPSWLQLNSFTGQDLDVAVAATSIGNPAESANAGMLAAGASNWVTPNTIEDFSSRGPTTDGRTAASASSNTVTPAPPPTLSISDVTVDEDAGDAVLTISMDRTTSTSVTVQYATTDGTATAPDDYAATSTTATILASQTSMAVQIRIVDDSLDEADETFSVALSAPSAGTQVSGSNGTSTVTITDNDAPAAPIPAISTWGLVVMAGLLGLVFAVRMGRRAPAFRGAARR